MTDRILGYIIRVVVASLIVLVCSPLYGDEIDNIIPYVIQVESGGRAEAISKAGAIGLMQITQCVVDEWNTYYLDNQHLPWSIHCPGVINNIEKLNDSSKCTFHKKYFCGSCGFGNTNVRLGQWYLRRLKDHYLKDNYTMERLLCAWNGGITKLRRYKYDCSKMPRESRNFSKKVINAYRKSQIR